MVSCFTTRCYQRAILERLWFPLKTELGGKYSPTPVRCVYLVTTVCCSIHASKCIIHRTYDGATEIQQNDFSNPKRAGHSADADQGRSSWFHNYSTTPTLTVIFLDDIILHALSSTVVLFNVHLHTVHYHHFNGSEQEGCQTTEQMHFNSLATSLYLIIILISNRLLGANCVSGL